MIHIFKRLQPPSSCLCPITNLLSMLELRHAPNKTADIQEERGGEDFGGCADSAVGIQKIGFLNSKHKGFPLGLTHRLCPSKSLQPSKSTTPVTAAFRKITRSCEEWQFTQEEEVRLGFLIADVPTSPLTVVLYKFECAVKNEQMAGNVSECGCSLCPVDVAPFVLTRRDEADPCANIHLTHSCQLHQINAQ